MNRRPPRSKRTFTRFPYMMLVRAEVLAAFVAQHYIDSGMPPVLVCSHALPDPDLMDLLAEQTGVKARVLVKPQSLRKTWLEQARSEEHTSEIQSLLRSSNAVFCLKKKNQQMTS